MNKQVAKVVKTTALLNSKSIQLRISGSKKFPIAADTKRMLNHVPFVTVTQSCLM